MEQKLIFIKKRSPNKDSSFLFKMESPQLNSYLKRYIKYGDTRLKYERTSTEYSKCYCRDRIHVIFGDI